MQMASTLLALLALPLLQAAEVSPIEKVVQLLSDLEGKIIGEGETAQKLYDEFAEFCEDRSEEVTYDIKRGKSTVLELKAAMAEELSLIESFDAKIGDLAASIGTDEADLKAATKIREKEAGDFAGEEKQLLEMIDTLSRAIAILQREMAKGGASMMQLKNAGNLVQALSVMVQASMLSSADGSKLTALLQSSSDDDEEGAPAATVYEGHSGGIIDTLESLKDKAEAQLEELRQKETTATHNYEMLKQSLEDSIKFASKDMADAKTSLAASSEKKSTAEGDLDSTSKTLAADIQALADLHHDCMSKATDFEAETKSRAEELKALAEAKKVVKETTGASSSIVYGLNQISFVQRAQMTSKAGSATFEVVHFVRELARKQKSSVLAQLAVRVASAVTSSDDPFSKVKGLISDMISKLEDEAAADAEHKAFCDKELSETHVKKSDKETLIGKLTTAIDSMTSKSSKLKEEVAQLQKALAALSKEQGEMDKLRGEEKELYTKQKADMELGLQGVKTALKVLREYYSAEGKSHTAAAGSGSGIVGLLEVVESDFSKELAEIIATEENAVATYKSETNDNEIEKTTKDQDVKYKTKESISLDKEIAEASSDRDDAKTQLASILAYLSKLEEQCIAKAETYEARKAHREAELAGLKEALTILESETAFVQKSSQHMLRGVHPH
jgi:DNA repair exonuclease SbcCD ATPase subunit